jgi:hypothetical protein
MAANNKAKWMKKLTAFERDHMRTTGCHSLEQARRTFETHAKWRKQNPNVEPCWDCKAIARKLGFPV